jgi:hypothetical protein
MTHIENIPHILQHGITHAISPNANPAYFPIGDGSIISTRNEFVLNNGRKLGEYIPFYFGVRTPMLYVIQKGYNMVKSAHAESIVYCVSSVQRIIGLNRDFIFTDGHAIEQLSGQFNSGDIQNIHNLLDFPAINSLQWKDDNDLDKKRRKQAEFLVFGDIDINAILGFIVYNEEAQNKLIGFGVSQKQTVVKRNYYF